MRFRDEYRDPQAVQKLVGAIARDDVGRPARVEPLTGQTVAVERKHAVEERVPLLDRQSLA